MKKKWINYLATSKKVTNRIYILIQPHYFLFLVRNCSKKILSDLEKCWKNNILLDGICQVIQKHAEDTFDVYIPYCENQVLLNDTLIQLK